MDWQKSSFSNSQGSCVEVARVDAVNLILVRNSNHPGMRAVPFTPYEMDAFIRGVKAGEFDQYLMEDAEPDVDGAGRTYEEYNPPTTDRRYNRTSGSVAPE